MVRWTRGDGEPSLEWMRELWAYISTCDKLLPFTEWPTVACTG